MPVKITLSEDKKTFTGEGYNPNWNADISMKIEEENLGTLVLVFSGHQAYKLGQALMDRARIACGTKLDDEKHQEINEFQNGIHRETGTD